MDLERIIKEFAGDHNDLYEKLDHFRNELIKVKKVPNNPFLLETTKNLIQYVDMILHSHFDEEEKVLFPSIKKYSSSNLNYEKVINHLLKEHRTIHKKLSLLKSTVFSMAKKANLIELDLRESVLYPTYNLIATIHHHAQREDREIFSEAFIRDFTESQSQDLTAQAA